MRVLVTGAYGVLGPVLCETLQAAGHVVFRQGRGLAAQVRCDPSDPVALASAVEACAPNVLINLIAKAAVDACESDPGAAFDANIGVIESIAAVRAVASGLHLVHISTDQVYGGSGPHGEERVAPANVYAITKYAGELVARRAGATVLRTNFVGRSPTAGRSTLSDWIVAALSGDKSVTVFGDILFSPLHISTVCRWIERAAVLRHPGVFNLGARGGVSKAAFAYELARLLRMDAAMLVVGDSADESLKARRPSDMTLSVARFEEAFSCELPPITDEIRLVARDYGGSQA